MISRIQQRLETAFHLNTLVGEDLHFAYEEGDLFAKTESSRLQNTKNPRVQMLIKDQGFETSWYFYLDGKCEGYIGMAKFMDRRLSAQIRYARIATPHCLMRKLRGSGYPTFIYRQALLDGIIFATLAHTKDAEILWERVADKTGARVLFYDLKAQRRVAYNSKNSAKLLVPPSLLHLFK